jgi:hypothetical protein
MTKHCWRGAAYWLLLVALAAAGERVWTDTQGQTIRGEFVREVDGEVTLLQDGKLVTLPLDKLSERDRQVVRDLASGKTVEEQQPRPLPIAAADPLPSVVNTPFAAEAKDKLPQALQKPIAIANRVWTDVQGNQTTAKFVRMFGGNVVLMRGAKTVTVRFYDLTSDDQDYVKELLKSQGKESEIPPPPKPAGDPPPGGAPPGPSGPGSSPPPSMPPPQPIGGGPSSQFEKLRELEEQRRQELQQRQEQQNQERAQRASESLQRLQERQESERQAREEAERNAIVASCSACKKGLNREQSKLTTCPHCGVTWTYEVDRWGHKRQIASVIPNSSGSNNNSSSTTSGSGGSETTTQLFADMSAETQQSVIIGVVVVGVLGLIAIVVFIAFSMASANTVSRGRRYF